jgi:hypothetical protein
MEKLSSAFEKANTSAAYINLIPALGIHFRIANSRTKWRCNFKGISQDWGRTDFSENFRA